MKLKKTEISIIIISIVFLSFTIGFFIGKSCAEDTVTVTGIKNISDEEVFEESTEISENTDENTGEAGNAAEDDVSEAYPININSATAEELERLPKIGGVLAERIISYREENGSFENTYEITNVHGIGEKIYAEIENYITVE